MNGQINWLFVAKNYLAKNILPKAKIKEDTWILMYQEMMKY